MKSCIFWYLDDHDRRIQVWKIIPYQSDEDLKLAIHRMRSEEEGWRQPYAGETGWHCFIVLEEGEFCVVSHNDESYGVMEYAKVDGLSDELKDYLNAHSVYNSRCRGESCMIGEYFRSVIFDWRGNLIFKSCDSNFGVPDSLPPRPNWLRWKPQEIAWYRIINTDWSSPRWDHQCKLHEGMKHPVVGEVNAPEHQCSHEGIESRRSQTGLQEVGLEIGREKSHHCWTPYCMSKVRVHCFMSVTPGESHDTLEVDIYVEDPDAKGFMEVLLECEDDEVGVCESWNNDCMVRFHHREFHTLYHSQSKYKLWVYYGP